MTTCTCNEEVCAEWCLSLQEYEEALEFEQTRSSFQILYERNLHNLMWNYLSDMGDQILQDMMIKAHRDAKDMQEMQRRAEHVFALEEALNDA